MVSAVGIKPEVERIYLWPECEQAWRVFRELDTQWQQGGGLNYASVLAHLREEFPRRDERRDVYSCVRACERGAIDGWARKHEREKARAEAAKR